MSRPDKEAYLNRHKGQRRRKLGFPSDGLKTEDEIVEYFNKCEEMIDTILVKENIKDQKFWRYIDDLSYDLYNDCKQYGVNEAGLIDEDLMIEPFKKALIDATHEYYNEQANKGEKATESKKVTEGVTLKAIKQVVPFLYDELLPRLEKAVSNGASDKELIKEIQSVYSNWTEENARDIIQDYKTNYVNKAEKGEKTSDEIYQEAQSTNVKEWYIKEYPDDAELGEEINPNITFYDVFEAMDNYEDIYDILGVDDSVVRERVFTKLDEILDNGSGYTYNQWLNTARNKRHQKYKTESKKLTEGPGAGYEVGATISTVGVNSFNITDTKKDKYGQLIYDLDCDIDVKLSDIQFSSYEYGGIIDSFEINAHISKLEMSEVAVYEDDEEHPELNNETIVDALEGATFNEMLGAGWVHSTFTGSITDADLQGNVYGDFTADYASIELTDEPVVTFIDQKVSGDLDRTTYDVVDDAYDNIDSFDTEEEAIEYAKSEEDASYVVATYHNYSIIDLDGSMDDDIETGEIIWEKGKEEESKKITESIDDVSYEEIIERMANATDYAELYDAASLIKNTSLRVDVETLIGDCEDSGDDVETAYSVVTSDLIDEHVGEENIEESKKVTESDDLDNADEEDLATLIFTEAYEDGIIDGQTRKLKDFELPALEDLQDWYDSTITEEQYNKAVSIVNKVIDNVEFYKDSEGSGTFIELSDNHTLWDIDYPEDIDQNEADEIMQEEYPMLVQNAAKDFEEETGTPLYFLGRSGRHVCVIANFINAYKVDELKQVQERLENEVKENIKAILEAGPVNESKELIESEEPALTLSEAEAKCEELKKQLDDKLPDYNWLVNIEALNIIISDLNNKSDFRYTKAHGFGKNQEVVEGIVKGIFGDTATLGVGIPDLWYKHKAIVRGIEIVAD